MKLSKEKRNQIVVDAMAINKLIVQLRPKPLRRKGKTKSHTRVPRLPVPKDSNDLCKRLVGIAGLDDSPERRALIYLAVRTLQRLDLAAVEAGILLEVLNI